MKLSTVGISQQAPEGEEKKCLNSELWHACAGPLVCLPTVGTRVVYFPQGHSEQVAASTNKEVEGHIPNYPSLPPQLFCQLHNVTMHADAETDEVYAQMTLQPLSSEEQKETYFHIEMDIMSKQPTNYFCKTLTASDTSTHGGFSVPRRAAEKVFPPLDFSQQPPAQELVARDLHDVEWKFRHIFRGQPKRHLLTTGWSVFVSAKRLVAGDSVLFIWNEKNQLLLGIRRANRPQTAMPSSVLSSDSMHIGLLAAAAHAAATNSRFTIFYNPRASPSEFVIPFSKYYKAVYHTRVSVGMRFRMLFETEESSVRRYMGTITGISDLDPVRWPSSHWRSVKVGWDESTAGERQPRVSLWEIEPLTTFPMYPSLFPLRLKRPWHPGAPLPLDNREDELNAFMWPRRFAGEQGIHTLNFPSLGMEPIGPLMQQRLEPLLLGNDLNQYQAMSAAALQEIRGGDIANQQFLQNQQALHLSQQFSAATPLLQHLDYQQTSQQQTMNSKMHCLPDNQTHSAPHQQLQHTQNEQHQQKISERHAYVETFQISNNHVQKQSNFSPLLFEKTVFPDSILNFSSVPTPSSVQGILGSSYPGGSDDSLSSSQLGQSPLGQQSQQFWDPKNTMSQMTPFSSALLFPSFSEKDTSVRNESTADAHSSARFAVGKGSLSALSNLVPNLSTSSSVSGIATLPFAGSCFENPSYGNLDGSSSLLQNAVETDPQSGTFVKIHKSGSVGRTLDISRFSSYEELREELGQMFGIEGLLDDPLRSGWQLVFVDREQDVLLLGDDPWESFVNNVWYIKILSPDDVQKMGNRDLSHFVDSS